MNTKTRIQILAEDLDELATDAVIRLDGHDTLLASVADKLRDLEAANAELLEALRGFVSQIEWGARISGTEGYLGEAANTARAAIAKHGGTP